MSFKLQRSHVIVIIAAVILWVAYITHARTSFADPVSPTGPTCHETPVSAETLCSNAYPDYPMVGDLIEDGAMKYCCK